jgi:hypothetical protein
MDQEVIASMKGHYLTDLEESDSTIALSKRMVVLDAIYGKSQAWSSMDPVMLVQSWRKVLPVVEYYQLEGFHNEEILIRCVLWETSKMLVKIMMKNGYKVICVNWVSST